MSELRGSVSCPTPNSRGSRKSLLKSQNSNDKNRISDKELSGRWPFLRRDQVHAFKYAFDLFDKDGGGSITSDELFNVIRSIGQHPTIAEVEAMVLEVDADGNGEIDFAEFLTMMLHKMNESSPENEIMDIFNVFDLDNSGTISAKELRCAMRVLGEKLSEEEIEDAIKLADASGDGEVDFEEFLHFVLTI
mmetsp:Transcript_15802/g.34249  ORF Transcript_15802/g.34249 Transcript_15802/m.34249 type:complete len:191 (-) Transcript_15802:402-974(-)